MRLSMIQSALRAYNASSQLISSVKRTFVENPNARRVMRVRIHSSLTAWKPKSFHQLIHPHHSAAQDQQYKITLHARHKLRAHSCTYVYGFYMSSYSPSSYSVVIPYIKLSIDMGRFCMSMPTSVKPSHNALYI